MNTRWKRLYLVPALLWAIFCASYTVGVIQNEKQRLMQQYVSPYNAAHTSQERDLPLVAKENAQRRIALRHYSNELRERYWLFGPFFWACLTLSGYIVAAGILLPLRWQRRM